MNLEITYCQGLERYITKQIIRCQTKDKTRRAMVVLVEKCFPISYALMVT